MEQVLSTLAGLPPPLVYAVLGLGAALENLVPPVPADTFVVLVTGAVLFTLLIIAGCTLFLAATTSSTVMLYLFAFQPYSQGYKWEVVSLWQTMTYGYKRKDAEWAFGYFVLPAVLVLLWLTRERYRDVPIKPSWIDSGS